jgi:hypothetical protein
MNFMLKSQTEELHLNSLKKLAEAYEQFSPTISSLILTNYTSQNPKFSKSFVARIPNKIIQVLFPIMKFYQFYLTYSSFET